MNYFRQLHRNVSHLKLDPSLYKDCEYFSIITEIFAGGIKSIKLFLQLNISLICPVFNINKIDRNIVWFKIITTFAFIHALHIVVTTIIVQFLYRIWKRERWCNVCRWTWDQSSVRFSFSHMLKVGHQY